MNNLKTVIILLSHRKNGKDVPHKDLLVERYTQACLDSSGMYLNLYPSRTAVRWSSCIELRHQTMQIDISFSPGNLLIYRNESTGIEMIYKMHDPATYEKIRELIAK